MKTRPVKDFLPRILSHIDGIDRDMVVSYVADAAIQFLRDTNLLTEIVCIDLENCINSYKIHTDYRINDIKSVRFLVNNERVATERFDYYIQDDVIYIDPVFEGIKVEIEVGVLPYRDSEELPEFLYEEWVEPIIELTLARLFLLKDNEWYNQSLAQAHLAIYEQFVRQARFSKITKHKPFTMRLLNKRRY